MVAPTSPSKVSYFPAHLLLSHRPVQENAVRLVLVYLVERQLGKQT